MCKRQLLPNVKDSFYMIKLYRKQTLFKIFILFQIIFVYNTILLCFFYFILSIPARWIKNLLNKASSFP